MMERLLARVHLVLFMPLVPLLKWQNDRDTEWKKPPTPSLEPMLQGLKPATKHGYLKALKALEMFAQANSLPLETIGGVDKAVYMYI